MYYFRTIDADDTEEDFTIKVHPPKSPGTKSPNRSPLNSNPQVNLSSL